MFCGFCLCCCGKASQQRGGSKACAANALHQRVLVCSEHPLYLSNAQTTNKVKKIQFAVRDLVGVCVGGGI